jgi:hypothetical protein
MKMRRLIENLIYVGWFMVYVFSERRLSFKLGFKALPPKNLNIKR